MTADVTAPPDRSLRKVTKNSNYLTRSRKTRAGFSLSKTK